VVGLARPWPGWRLPVCSLLDLCLLEPRYWEWFWPAPSLCHGPSLAPSLFCCLWVALCEGFQSSWYSRGFEGKEEEWIENEKNALFKEIPGYDNDTPLPNNEYTYT